MFSGQCFAHLVAVLLFAIYIHCYIERYSDEVSLRKMCPALADCSWWRNDMLVRRPISRMCSSDRIDLAVRCTGARRCCVECLLTYGEDENYNVSRQRSTNRTTTTTTTDRLLLYRSHDNRPPFLRFAASFFVIYAAAYLAATLLKTKMRKSMTGFVVEEAVVVDGGNAVAVATDPEEHSDIRRVDRRAIVAVCLGLIVTCTKMGVALALAYAFITAVGSRTAIVVCEPIMFFYWSWCAVMLYILLKGLPIECCVFNQRHHLYEEGSRGTLPVAKKYLTKITTWLAYLVGLTLFLWWLFLVIYLWGGENGRWTIFNPFLASAAFQ